MRKRCFQGNYSKDERWIYVILRNENGHIKEKSVSVKHIWKNLAVIYLCVCCVVVLASGPSCLWPRFLTHLLHAASDCRIPSEGEERSLRLLLALRNMKRPMQRAGLAANEQTVGGWLLPHTSAADGPSGNETQGGQDQRIGTGTFFFFFLHYLKIWMCNLEARNGIAGKNRKWREKSWKEAHCRFFFCAIKKARQILILIPDRCCGRLRRCCLYWSLLSQ